MSDSTSGTISTRFLKSSRSTAPVARGSAGCCGLLDRSSIPFLKTEWKSRERERGRRWSFDRVEV
jgi:hypothetical protein